MAGVVSLDAHQLGQPTLPINDVDSLTLKRRIAKTQRWSGSSLEHVFFRTMYEGVFR